MAGKPEPVRPPGAVRAAVTDTHTTPSVPKPDEPAKPPIPRGPTGLGTSAVRIGSRAKPDTLTAPEDHN